MPRGFDTPREELDAGHEAWVERQERAADTPARIATPEETAAKLLEGVSFTVPTRAGALVERARLREKIAAALASSNAENERLKENAPGAWKQVFEDMRADFLDMERKNASLTAQVGRMRGLLSEAAEELSVVAEQAHPEHMRLQYPSYQLRWEQDMDLPNRIRAALSPTEPEGKT